MSKIFLTLIVLCIASANGLDIEFDYFAYKWGNKLHPSEYTFRLSNIKMTPKNIKRIIEEESFVPKASQVITLYITHTKKTHVPNNLVKSFENIKNIRIENTDLEYLKNESSNGLEKIENLFLGSNQIKEIAEGAFEKLVNVRNLYLHRNQISHMNDLLFYHMAKLEMIYLDENKLATLSAKIFSKNLHLERIYARSNAISSIDPSFFDPPLKHCDLKYNKCINLSTFGNNLQELKYHAEKNCK